MNCPLSHDTPVTPDDGYTICYRHIQRLRDDLHNIAQILPNLDALLVTPTPLDGNDRRAARTDAPAPLRLDILDLTDPRSDTPALHYLDSWCRHVTQQRHLSAHPRIPERQALWLVIHVDWLAREDDAATCAQQINQAWRWLRAGAGMAPPAAIFTCPEPTFDDDGTPNYEQPCGGPVHQNPYNTHEVRCTRCRTTWDGAPELRRLGILLDTPHETLAYS